MTELMLIVSVGAGQLSCLVQFLGVRPAMIMACFHARLLSGMGLATGLAAHHRVGRELCPSTGSCFEPFDLQYLKILSFVVVVGASIQLTNALARRFSPLLHRVLGVYVPLIASNCALLGVALLNSAASRSFVAALFYGAGASVGFGIALALIAGLRERIARADVPMPFRGAAIVFVTAGILSLAFLGFAGFARL